MNYRRLEIIQMNNDNDNTFDNGCRITCTMLNVKKLKQWQIYCLRKLIVIIIFQYI
jgi:hypothetical protein